MGVLTRCPLYLFGPQKAKKDAAPIVNANDLITIEPGKEVSKDIEPNDIWGDKYLQLLKQEIKRFKGIK